MTVERHELRKRNTVKTVSTAPSMSADCTLSTDASTREPASRMSFSSTPGGRSFCSVATLSITAWLTVVVDALVVFLISMPTALLASKAAPVRGSSAPSYTRATSARRTMRPAD